MFLHQLCVFGVSWEVRVGGGGFGWVARSRASSNLCFPATTVVRENRRTHLSTTTDKNSYHHKSTGQMYTVVDWLLMHSKLVVLKINVLILQTLSYQSISELRILHAMS